MSIGYLLISLCLMMEDYCEVLIYYGTLYLCREYDPFNILCVLTSTYHLVSLNQNNDDAIVILIWMSCTALLWLDFIS